MSDRSSYRPRKVVDYSKFVDNDSDSDDFSLPSAKKSKSSKAETASNGNSKLSKSKNDKVIDSGDGNDSKRQETKKTINNVETEVKSAVIVCNKRPTKSTATLETKLTDEDETSSGCDSKPKSTCTSDSSSTKSESVVEDEDSSDDVIDHHEVEEVKVKASRSNINSPKVVPRSQVKWKPPASARSADMTISTKLAASPSNSGLRVGLSRNARTKPLHTNVKMQS